MKSARVIYCALPVIFALAISACTSTSSIPPGCQMVDLNNGEPTPFAHTNPQNFGDLIELARQYPNRKLLWCAEGQIIPYTN